MEWLPTSKVVIEAWRGMRSPPTTSTDFEDYVFRSKEQSFGELLGVVVNLS